MYRLELTSRAQRELDKLQSEILERILIILQGLRDNPRPPGAIKLKGPVYRVRVGEWRVIYAVFDRDRLIIVGKVARRSEHTYKRVDELF